MAERSGGQSAVRVLKIVGTIAALLTAVAGLLKAFHDVGWIGDKKADAEVVAQNEAPSSEKPARKVSAPKKTPGSPSQAPEGRQASATGTRPAAKPPASAPSVQRAAFKVRLPSKREYTTGHGINDGRFMLVNATLTAQTQEADILKIEWRFLSRSPYAMEFRSDSFTLRVNNDLIRPEHFFLHNIAPGENRDGELDFVLNAGIQKAALRFGALGVWEIPLEFSADLPEGEATNSWAPDKLGREPFDIQLPAKKEYAMGDHFSPGVFTLLGARLIPKTPESDAIAIQWRLRARGPHPVRFDDFSVVLDADGKEIKPEHSFNYEIRPDDSREGELLFVTQPGVSRAELQLWRGSLVIRLDVGRSRP